MKNDHYELRFARTRQPGDSLGGIFADHIDDLVQSVAHNADMVWHVIEVKTCRVVAHSAAWAKMQKDPAGRS